MLTALFRATASLWTSSTVMLLAITAFSRNGTSVDRWRY
jgi:hypothetical protein